MRKSVVALLIISTLAALVSCASAPTTEPEEASKELRIGVVAFAPFHALMSTRGALEIAQKLGGTYVSGTDTRSFGDRFIIEVVIQENPSVTEFGEIAKRCRAIITSEDEYIQLISYGERTFPDVQFISVASHIGGVEEDDNVTTYQMNNTHGAFFAGMAAGAGGAEKIAYLGPIRNDWVDGLAAAFFSGAMYMNLKYLNPDTIDYSVVGNWNNADMAKMKSAEMYQSGIQLIYADTIHSNSGVYAAAKENNGEVVGVLQFDLPPLRVDGNRIVGGNLIGENLTAVVVRRIDVIISYAVQDFIEHGRPKDRYIDTGGLIDNAYTLMGPNDRLIARAISEARKALPAVRHGILQIPEDPNMMERYMEQVSTYRKQHPLAPLAGSN